MSELDSDGVKEVQQKGEGGGGGTTDREVGEKKRERCQLQSRKERQGNYWRKWTKQKNCSDCSRSIIIFSAFIKLCC